MFKLINIVVGYFRLLFRQPSKRNTSVCCTARLEYWSNTTAGPTPNRTSAESSLYQCSVPLCAYTSRPVSRLFLVFNYYAVTLFHDNFMHVFNAFWFLSTHPYPLLFPCLSCQVFFFSESSPFTLMINWVYPGLLVWAWVWKCPQELSRL